MPYTPPTVNYSTSMTGTYTTLTGVKSVSFNRGRQRFIDPFPSTSCVIELIPANSYATPLAVGQYIDVRPTNSAASPAYFVGQISDVQRFYDMPYNPSTGAAPGDRIVITALGPLGILGRTQANSASYSVLEQVSTTTNMIRQTAARFFNTNANNFAGASNFGRLVQAQTTSNPPLDILNVYAATDPMYLADRDNARAVSTRPSGSGYVGLGPVDWQITQVGQQGDSANVFTFSDAGDGYKYNAMEYGTGAENTFTQVNVITENVDGGTVIPVQTVQTGFAPYSSLNWTSYVETSDFSGQPNEYALQLANYIFSRSYIQNPAPFSITTTTAVDYTITELAKMNTVMPGLRGLVTFRGQSFRVTLEGLDVSFGLDFATVRAYFSPWPLTNFILDSTINGLLNTNTLAAL